MLALTAYYSAICTPVSTHLGVSRKALIFEIAHVLIQQGGIVLRPPLRQCYRQAPPRPAPIPFRIYWKAAGAITYGYRAPPVRTRGVPPLAAPSHWAVGSVRGAGRGRWRRGILEPPDHGD